LKQKHSDLTEELDMTRQEVNFFFILSYSFPASLLTFSELIFFFLFFLLQYLYSLLNYLWIIVDYCELSVKYLCLDSLSYSS